MMSLRQRILSCLNECHIMTVRQLWNRFNVNGYKLGFAIEDMQMEGILMNVSDPGYPIGWEDFFSQGDYR